MLSNSFQTNYVLVEPRDVRFALRRHRKREERAYYLGAMYGCHHGTEEECLAGASKKGYLGMVNYLVSRGANVRAGRDHALRFASKEGHLGVVKYLVSKGADIRARQEMMKH